MSTEEGIFRRSDESDEAWADRVQTFLKECCGELSAPPPVLTRMASPPWLEYPSIGRYSAGWRMGPGEDYMIAFLRLFRTMNEGDRDAYIADNPEPEDWQGWYRLVKASEYPEQQ